MDDVGKRWGPTHKRQCETMEDAKFRYARQWENKTPNGWSIFLPQTERSAAGRRQKKLTASVGDWLADPRDDGQWQAVSRSSIYPTPHHPPPTKIAWFNFSRARF